MRRNPPRRKRWTAWLGIFWGPYALLGGLLMAGITAAAWIWREELHTLFRERTALLPSSFVAVFVMTGVLVTGLWIEHTVQRRGWLRRAERKTGLEGLAPPTMAQQILARLPDPLEWLFSPLLKTRVGQRWAQDWIDAELGAKASRYLLILGLSAMMGGIFGWRIGGPILGLALAVIFPLLPRQIVVTRASSNRRRFGEQLPQALDALGAGLAAGLSFPQAVEYATEELPKPIVEAFLRLQRRISLGHPVDRSLQRLLQESPEEGLALVIDGIILQRQFGGDLIGMLEETASLLRERLELEREVRAVTTQGRLSGWVVASLVPVSAGILLFSNPVYIDILFDTLIGQILLVVALLLQLLGWGIISRMVRIRY